MRSRHVKPFGLYSFDLASVELTGSVLLANYARRAKPLSGPVNPSTVQNQSSHQTAQTLRKHQEAAVKRTLLRYSLSQNI